VSVPGTAQNRLNIVGMEHFKKVNDTHGHAAGDEVLREIARRILRNIRVDDFACRMGGEEFLVSIGNPQASGKNLNTRGRTCFVRFFRHKESNL
jgi:diguanylate cyclase (GGDEF)-like protein